MPLHRAFFTALALVTLVVSCTKDDRSNAGDGLLYRIASDNDSLLSATFFYDAQNRLVKMVDSIRYGHQWETSVSYNAAGKAEKLTTIYRSPANVVDFAVVDSLVYEGGRAVRKYQDWPYAPHAGHYVLTHNYFYDATGRLVTDIGGETLDLAYAGWYQTFNYDVNDNLIKMDEKYYTLGTRTTTLSYNSNLNPYHETGLILYFVKGDNLLLGKHHKIKTVRQVPGDETLTIDYAYEYNRDEQLQKMIIKRSQAGTSDSTSTFAFFYK